MKRRAALAALLLLAACQSLPPQEAAQPWLRGAPPFTGEVESLLLYHDYLRRLPPAEQAKEHEAAKQAFARSRSDFARLRLALATGLPGTAFRNDATALALLEPMLKEGGPAGGLRGLAQLWHGVLQERRRAEERARDDQKNLEALQQKLEALKSIEKSLSERGTPAPGGRR